MKSTSLTDFGRIDRTGDAASFVSFLDAACAADSFQAYKRHLIVALNLGPSSISLDVGCGTGDDARVMAASGGRVVGVDNSAAMIDEARRRGGAGVEFQAADATALPFADGSFTAARADRSLMHVPEARRALGEMVRVTAAGGRVAVFEVDFGTVAIDCDDRALATAVVAAWSGGLRDAWLGRRFPGLFADHGLADVSVTPYVLLLPPPLALPILGRATVERGVQAGTLSAADGERWLRELAGREARGRFFCTITGFLVAGTKPG